MIPGVYYSFSRKHKDKSLSRDTPSGIIVVGLKPHGTSLRAMFRNEHIFIAAQVADDKEYKLPLQMIQGAQQNESI